VILPKWKTVLAALFCGLILTPAIIRAKLLRKCRRRSGDGDGGPATGPTDDRVARTHVSVSHCGNPAAGQRAHSETLFTEGSDVQAGQELYQIDPAPFQAALDNAMAALAGRRPIDPPFNRG